MYMQRVKSEVTRIYPNLNPKNVNTFIYNIFTSKNCSKEFVKFLYNNI